MVGPAGIRASDDDRDRLAGAIRDHFAAGRLSQEELDPRLQAAYAARTHAELDAVRADLPALAPSPGEQRAELVARRRHLQRRLIQQTGGALMAFLICTIVWLAAGAHGAFWPVWVAIAPAVMLLRGGWALYGPAPELERVERELEQREELRTAERRRARAQARERRRLER